MYRAQGSVLRFGCIAHSCIIPQFCKNARCNCEGNDGWIKKSAISHCVETVIAFGGPLFVHAAVVLFDEVFDDFG